MEHKKRPKIGVALGSGGARGLVHIPALECIEELGIRPYCIAGSSMGAIVSVLYAYGTMDNFKKKVLSMTKKDIIKLLDLKFSKSGLIKGEKIMKFLSRFIPEDLNIEDLKIKTAIVATDYENGKPVIFRKGNVLNAIRASISIPGIFFPIKYHECILIDGGIVNPLPIDIVKKMGAEKTIAVNLNPGAHKRKNEISKPEASNMKVVGDKFNSVIPIKFKKEDDSVSLFNWFTDKKKNKVPSVYESMIQTLGIFEYQNSLLMIKNHPPDVLIEPHVFDMFQLDFSKAKMIYQHGVEICKKHKKSIKKIMQ